MRIVKAHESQEVPNPHGVSARKLYASGGAEIVLIALRPGESLKNHAVPVEAVFYVLEGEGTVEIGDEEARVTADCLVPCPAGAPHRLRSEGPGMLRFLVIKLPGSEEAPCRR